MNAMKLSIIVPVYNEERTVLAILKNIEAVSLPHNITKEIIVIDDGSTDTTKEKLKELTNPSIKIFSHPNNQGKTAAVKLGIEKSTGDIILIQDADLEYSPTSYPELLEPILNNKASVVYGSRFQGNIENMELINRLANRISNITVNFLYHTRLTDIHTCFKVFKKEVIKNIKIESRHFSFDAEITAKLLNKGYNIIEVPIPYTARSRKSGKKINWFTATEGYFVLLKCRLFRKC